MGYTGYFKDITRSNGTTYAVRFNGGGTEIELGNSPFILTYENPDILYKPAKYSSATIKLVTNDYIADFMTSNPRGVSVELYNSKEHHTEWLGYLTPNVYNQPYNYQVEEMDIEAVDELSTLDYVDYSTVINNYPDIQTAYQIIMKILNGYTNYDWLFVSPNLYITANTCILAEMSFNEAYFVEQNWTCKDVLENICSYLNYTIIAYQNAVYMLDYDKLADSYFRYSIDDGTVSKVSLGQTKAIASLFSNAETTLSANEIYKSVSITCNVGDWEDITAKLYDEEKTINRLGDWGTWNIDKYNTSSDLYTEQDHYPTVLNTNERVVRTKYLSNPVITRYGYTTSSSSSVVTNPNITDLNDFYNYYNVGDFIIQEDGRNSETLNTFMNPETYIILVNNGHLPNNNPLVKLRYSTPKIVGNAGYLSLTGSCCHLPQKDLKFFYYPDDGSSLKWKGNTSDYTTFSKLRYSLKVGNYYYTGSGWSTTAHYNLISLNDLNKKSDMFNAFQDFEVQTSKDYSSQGIVIPLAEIPVVAGFVEVCLYPPHSDEDDGDWQTVNKAIFSCVLVKDLSLEYIQNPTYSKGDSTDIEYSSDINFNSVKDYSITHKLLTFTGKKPADNYSLLSNGGFVGNVSKGTESGISAKLEEYKVSSIASQYGINTIVLDLYLDNSINIFDTCTWTTIPNKNFVVDTKSIDFYLCRTYYKLIEKH